MKYSKYIREVICKMETVRFSEIISIEPRYLNSDIMSTITEKVYDKYRNFCNQKWGYIIDIKSINPVKNMIDRVSSNIFFTVEIEAESFLPKEEATIDTIIQIVFQHGIICKFQDMNILIPIATIPGAKFENGTIKKDKKVYKKDDEIKVCLTKVKYEKHKYSAVGKLL